MLSTKKIITSLAAAAAVFAGHSAFAQTNGLADAWSLEAGGGEHVQVLRLSGQKDWNKNWFATRGYHLGGYWDGNIAYWRANKWLDQPDHRRDLAVVGFTPVFRWEADNKLGWYADAGIGLSLFSNVYRNTHRQLSTAFEFADHVGVGYVFANKWELGLRAQHYSNGGIKHPNGGVNLLLLKASYHY